VFLDAEHFFDGYRSNPGVRAEVVPYRPQPAGPRSSHSATPTAACCRPSSPTSSTPFSRRPSARLGHPLPQRHLVRRSANSLAAVDAGATHVQGTLNGYGERTGNADLVAVVANLELKRAAACSRRAPAGELPHRARPSAS
jgi:2-isopropylmalate synthase